MFSVGGWERAWDIIIYDIGEEYTNHNAKKETTPSLIGVVSFFASSFSMLKRGQLQYHVNLPV